MEIESQHTSDLTETTHRAAIRNDAHETLSGPSKADSEPVKETVLEALYRQHPEVGLEDVLEFNALISAPESGSITEQVDAVLTSVEKRAAIAPFDTTETTPDAEKVTISHHETQ